MSGADVVVLGVKERSELKECLEAEAVGLLDQATIDEIDQAIR
jgi:aryl-alcohol dehydrogenase-like predicted oxidoreductase|tara:strand:+ start:218 stop:346 length:129 start_codon:yes stop_codon:yes gene_type:complete